MQTIHHATSRSTVIICALALGLLVASPLLAAAGQYQGPSDVIASDDGKTLYVVNEDAGQIAVLDLVAKKLARSIDCPARPTGVVLDPDGKTLYVTCAAPEGSVIAVDVASGKITATIATGHWATGPSILPDGSRLYVCNQFDNDVSVIDLAAGKVIARVPAVREPLASTATPDGKLIFVSNQLPVDRSDSYDVAASVSVIDTATNEVSHIRLLNGSASLHEVCVSPDGKYAYVAHILARYQMPTTQLERGWMNTNALSIIDVAEKKLLNTVLLDDIDLGAAIPWGVAVTPDGKSICVTHSATHELSVIDAPAMLEKLENMPADIEAAKAAGRYDTQGTYSSTTIDDVPNDLAFLVGLRRRVRLQPMGPWGWLDVKDPTAVNGPRGMAIVGSKVYIATYFSDNLVVVDLESELNKPVAVIALGPKPDLTIQRRGEILFHDATLCFQHWQSCVSCHPQSRVDGLNWDLMNDGLGNPKNVRSMLLAHKTPPAMSSGIRPDAESAVRSGITHIQFAVRPEEEAVAIDEYLKSLEAVPSPHLVDGQLSEAAVRGKALFLSEEIDCTRCHPAPIYSDLKMHDVGSRGKYDRRDDYDTPTLIEVWRTAPYMHDGAYVSIKELLTEGGHGKIDQKLTDQQIDDLVEFVQSL